MITDKAAIEGLLDAIRADTALQPTVVNKEFLIAEKARAAEDALQRLLAGETREGVQRSIPISEIRALWMPLTSLPNIEAAGKFMSGMSKLIERYDHD